MAKLALQLANFSGEELNRAGYSGSGNWSPPPPTFMTNGITYGPIYLLTGSLFNVQLGYTMNTALDVGTGTELFDIEIFTPQRGSTPSGAHIFSLGYGLYIYFKSVPANQGIRYQLDKNPEGFKLILTYEGSGGVSTS